MEDAGENAQRALEFCDRALDHLKCDDAQIEEAVTLVEGIRNELLAMVGISESARLAHD